MQDKPVMIVSSGSIQAFTVAQEIAAILPVGVAKQRYRNQANHRPYTINPVQILIPNMLYMFEKI